MVNGTGNHTESIEVVGNSNVAVGGNVDSPKSAVTTSI